jgi:HSP20 family protein
MDDDEKDDWPSRRWRGLFGPWGMPDMDEMMREMERTFSEQFKELEKDLPKNLVRESTMPDGTTKKEIGPIVYGYSVTIGPDGKPVIREFGNVKKGEGPAWKSIQDKREPLIDIVTSDNVLRVIAELPGVNKEDIDITMNGRSLAISVDTPNRKYHKELDLPVEVDPNGAKSTYNNGVLEVTMPVKSPGGPGVKLKVD